MNLLDNAPRLTSPDQLNTEGCISLVEAIVHDATEEYICARRNYKKNPYDKKSILHYNQMRRWFLSEYFHRLTNLDGKAILERLDAE